MLNETLQFGMGGNRRAIGVGDMIKEKTIMTGKAICKQHGDVSVWVVCKHVGAGSADTIIFSKNQDALCFNCAHNFKTLTEQDVVGMCEECLKDFTAKLMIGTKTFANLQNRVKGIEYLKGKSGRAAEDEEMTGSINLT